MLISQEMTFTETTYDAAVLASYDDIVTMLTADTSNESLFTTTNKGLAQILQQRLVILLIVMELSQLDRRVQQKI